MLKIVRKQVFLGAYLAFQFALLFNTFANPALKLSSPAFHDQGPIPSKYTKEGEDMSPPLVFQGIPQGTRSLALVCEDPDAPKGAWIHWVIYNIPPILDHVEEKGSNLPQDIRLGKNSWGTLGYGGPQPPSGTHHYIFTLYALDTVLKLKEGATAAELRQAMQGHILEKAMVTGLFTKHPNP